jgi:hypothetical protein
MPASCSLVSCVEGGPVSIVFDWKIELHAGDHALRTHKLILSTHARCMQAT